MEDKQITTEARGIVARGNMMAPWQFALLPLLAAVACTSIASLARQPFADQRNLIDEVHIAQDDINEINAGGDVTFEELFYAGKHIFSNRFTSEDHYGEGPQGPRRSKYAIEDRGDAYPFLRFNGLDSQSCLECHLAIGFAAQCNYPNDPSSGERFAKQLGFVAGGAGFASNAFGLPEFGCRNPEDCDHEHSTRGVTRNPPHAFGAGYTQTLAEEMSWELQGIVEAARVSGPGTKMALVSKGVSFGEVEIDAEGVVQLDLDGISEDLIVRPFQWRGIAQNLRNFIRDAMVFHFSVQPREFLADPMNADKDDKDGLKDEILEGDISAVATFLAFMRPPTESSEGLDDVMVDRGRELFASVKCATCHVPSLALDSPYATIRDPRKDADAMRAMKKGEVFGMQKHDQAMKRWSGKQSSERGFEFISYVSTATPTLEKYHVKKQMLESLQQEAAPPASAAAKNKALAGALRKQLKGFSRDLNRCDGPPESLPRLPSEGDRVEVPLYSDLKRHRMGANLAEHVSQADDGGNEVPGDVFLTRPLWGVADTAPWLHDGRALTLIDAILGHEGEGSEANESITLFKGLSASDQQAVRAFLSSLRLPTVH